MANLLGWVISAGLMLLVIGGVVVGIQAFQGTITDNTTTEWEVLNDSLNLFENAGDQLGTVGTMVGVGLLVGVILVAFAGFSMGRNKGYF